MHITRTPPRQDDTATTDDDALAALTRLADAVLAPHSLARFEALRDVGATARELAAVFGLSDVSHPTTA